MMVTSSFLLMELLSDTAASAIGVSNEPSTFALALFSGNRPTKAQLQALAVDLGNNYSYEAYYDTTKIAALLTTLTGKTVISMVNQNAALPVEWTAGRITLPFAGIPDSTTSLQDDAPTWGVVMLYARSTSANFTSWQGRVMLYFTVGDQNSAADLKIQGGVIPKTSTWKPNDIVLNVSGAIA